MSKMSDVSEVTLDKIIIIINCVSEVKKLVKRKISEKISDAKSNNKKYK